MLICLDFEIYIESHALITVRCLFYIGVIILRNCFNLEPVTCETFGSAGKLVLEVYESKHWSDSEEEGEEEEEEEEDMDDGIKSVDSLSRYVIASGALDKSAAKTVDLLKGQKANRIAGKCRSDIIHRKLL